MTDGRRCQHPGCEEEAVWRRGTNFFSYFCEDHLPPGSIRASEVASRA